MSPRPTRALGLFCYLLFAVLAIAPGLASADIGQRLPRLTRLADEAVRGGMPLGYVPLRQIWAEWDLGDPQEVEASLQSVARDPRASAPIRAYAGLLEAYARRRRGDLSGAKKRIKELGFVGSWIVAGPFDNEGKAGLDRKFGPEEEIADALSMTRTYDGKERQVGNRIAPDVFPYGWVDLGAMMRPQEKICGYATTFVRDARTERGGPQPFSVWFGASGAVKVFFDGAVVATDAKYRDLDSDRVGVTLVMREGWHRLTVKVCGDDDAPLFALRLADPTGAPSPHLETSADPARAREAAAVRFHKGERAAPPVIGGPLAAFEKLVAHDDAAALEAFARWLVLTSSDDPSEHRARDLARRAADKSPTVPRCLLAGELAENRNQRAIWIDKAEDVVRKQKNAASIDDRIATLLARADHTRGGANWRDAIPFYEKVLALDPDDVRASLAQIELFSEAGLRETALSSLDRALARRPRSVALLRATANALRELDRTTEAEEVSARFANLRYDDTATLTERIERALAQRDAALANRWIERLVETNPDSGRSLAAAAKAYVALGDRAKAIALHRRALDLAPEDVTTLRALADVYAIGGQADEQLRLLRQVLQIKPQEKDVREYVAHTEPSKPRADEAYARPSAEFLKRRNEPAQGRTKRTLVDLQVTTVFPNGLASRFHQVVFQPLTDAAAAEAREYGFAFEADSETVQLRGARIYRKNGQIDEAIESGEGATDDPAMAMYSSARAFYVHFPRLDPGDVVELLYRVEDVAHRNAFADYFGEVVYLQSTEPVARAEYVLITPKSRAFYFNQPWNGIKPVVEEKGEQRIWRFTAENVAPLDPEPGMPPLSELLGHVHVSTYKDWGEMGRWYWGLVKDQFIADDEVRRRALEITKGLTDEKAKVKAVYDFVVQKTRYVALEFGIHGFKPYRCSQIFARGFGDCKDKATLIVTMLKELGINATIVILRTGLKGDFETEPASLAPFDHAIAYVPSLDWYLDGTAEFTGSGELPSMDRGALAIQINEGKPKLVHLPDPPPSESVASKHVEAAVNADGSAQIDWHVEVSGSSASSWRQRYHAKATQRQRVQEDLANELPGLEVSSVVAGDLDDIERKVDIRAKGKAPAFARKDGDLRTVALGAREHLVRSYAPLSSRRGDVRIPALATQENETIVKLPPGAKITSAPRASDGTSPFGSFKVETETSGNVVRLKTTVSIAKSRIRASEYAAFRAFCEQVDRELGQTLSYTVAK